MTATFKQIRSDKDISEKESFGTIVVSSIFILGFGVLLLKVINVNPLIVGLLLLLSAWLGRPLLRKFYPDNLKKKDAIGQLIFSSEKIISTTASNNLSLTTTNITSLNLSYNYVKGKQFAAKDIIHNGLAKVTLTDVNGNSEEIKFIIETLEQLDSLKIIITEYYKKGIKVTEKMGRYQVKTILFQTDLSFEQINKLKKELNVETFY